MQLIDSSNTNAFKQPCRQTFWRRVLLEFLRHSDKQHRPVCIVLHARHSTRSTAQIAALNVPRARWSIDTTVPPTDDIWQLLSAFPAHSDNGSSELLYLLATATTSLLQPITGSDVFWDFGLVARPVSEKSNSVLVLVLWTRSCKWHELFGKAGRQDSERLSHA